MKIYANAVKLSVVLLMALCASGCINVDYVGQTFPPLPEGTPVKIYSQETPVPAGEYRIIGRVNLTAPDGTSMEEINKSLTDLAIRHGAEAVKVVDYKFVELGLAAPDTSFCRSPSWNRDNRNAGGAYIYTNSFGEITSLEKAPKQVTELQMRAQLLATVKRFNEMESLYRQEREKLEKITTNPVAENIENTTESALNKAARPVIASPARPTENTTWEKPAVRVKLTDERDQPVAL